MSSHNSDSEERSHHDRMETEVSDKHKVYITNLDGTVSIFAK
jgi:hypothetical protein